MKMQKVFDYASEVNILFCEQAPNETIDLCHKD